MQRAMSIGKKGACIFWTRSSQGAQAQDKLTRLVTLLFHALYLGVLAVCNVGHFLANSWHHTGSICILLLSHVYW